MRKGGDDSSKSGLGELILGALSSILTRCEELKRRFGYPGEGLERPFRGWLASDLLEGVLGWRSDRVVIGERFDITLWDSEGFPVATIETKPPYQKASQKERATFEKRLSGLGTLRTAYLTNGAQWERLDLLFHPDGKLEISGRLSCELESITAQQAESFFAPLVADRKFTGKPHPAKAIVSAESPHVLEGFAAHLQDSIDDLSLVLDSLFSGLRDRKAGKEARDVAISLFDLWCEGSLIVPPRQAAKRLAERADEAFSTAREATKAVADVGLTGNDAAAAVEALLLMPKPERSDSAAVAEALWPAYKSAINKLCVQTAHVILARALLYRIGEDQGVFEPLLSGEGLEKALAIATGGIVDRPEPATALLSRVRLSMQNFLPAVYMEGEFDWWLVKAEKRPLLSPAERAWLRNMDREVERAEQRLLRMLGRYSFARVDVDVWRNVYQHYLPPEERQRLGGFYTPDELVNLILDLSQFVAGSTALCRLSFIDPASGSGAFVTNALARLLKHLNLDLECHTEVRDGGLPEWKRAERVLNIVATNLHAVDLHPFAAFLTTLNVLFLLMPLYARARRKNPNFSLDLQIFSADSLEKPDEHLLEPELFARLNSRVQLARESLRRYREMLKLSFDRVFGNPPWGGVLKGSLAPVYDNAKKQRFAREYKASAKGKYDVYGLFVERTLQILKPGGRFGLLTQDTFIDKEWAASLRELLASKAHVNYIVDLNPFGQLFFGRMNTPCITVADAVQNAAGDGECIAVLSAAGGDFKGLTQDERRKRVISTIRVTINELLAAARKNVVDFAHGAVLPLKRLRETAKQGWDLSGSESALIIHEGWPNGADLLEMRQGVTPGGCLELFLMSADRAQTLQLESALAHRAIKSKEINRWHVSWEGRVLLYPYRLRRGQATPAFALDFTDVEDEKVADLVRQVDLRDALDFDKQIDDREREIAHRQGVNKATVNQLLEHRIALKLVRYPETAKYLIQNYERLEGRRFKKQNIRHFGRKWYEYLWPRGVRPENSAEMR